MKYGDQIFLISAPVATSQLCLMDSTLYYRPIWLFPEIRRGLSGTRALLQQLIHRPVKHMADYKIYIHGGCTISGKDGRLYLGGYNPVMQNVPAFRNQHGVMVENNKKGKNVYTVWCLNAKDNSLIWSLILYWQPFIRLQ